MPPIAQVSGPGARTEAASPSQGTREYLPASVRAAATTHAVFWLGEDGRVSRWTEDAAALFGLPADEALGLHFRDLYPHLDREAGRPELALSRAREDGWWEEVGWRPTRHGRPFWAASTLTHVRAPSGEGVGHQVSVRDLTELTSLSPESLMHPSAPRLLSVGRVAAGVAHDLSNILAAVRGFAAALERHVPLKGASKEAWQGLVHTCDRGTMVMRRLLDVGRSEADAEGQPSIDLESLVRGLEPLLRQVLPKRILLVTALDDDLPEVAARAADLELILLNLVVNARDAIAAEGTIAIEARPARGDGDEAGGGVVLSVRDSGAGMEPEVRDRAFEPFFTTKGSGGTGLGLALVRDAALACGGSIQVDSRRGGGTRVGVRLRAAGGRRGEGGSLSLRPTAAVPGRGGRGLALLCSDAPHVRDILASLLRRRGLDVVHASTAQGARALLREHGGEIDVAIVSGPMRGLEATDLFGAPAAETGRPPAVFVAAGDRDDARRGPACPGDRTLAGPLDPERLLAAVAELLSEAGATGWARLG